jgi:DNA-directed RNA polymerase specialized sigma24 family protein
MLSVHTLMQEARVDSKARLVKPSFGRKEERRLLAEAIDRLPEAARLVLGLRHYEAVRPRDIANILGLDEEAVRDMLSEAVATVLKDLRQASAAAEKGSRTSEMRAARPRKRTGR